MANLKTSGDMKSPMIFENLKWLTVNEAATYLRRTSGAIRNLIYRGQIRPRRWAGRVYINRAELDRKIESGLR